MQAMVLAAGRGERMRPLTDSVPKPLLTIGGKALIDYHLHALADAEVTKVVINTGHLGEQIHDHIDHNSFGLDIAFSDEGDQLLETAGGIIKALPQLGDEPFIVTNADIFTAFDYSKLPDVLDGDAHLVLVPNPPHHPDGDFNLEQGRLVSQAENKYTYSGMGLYHPRFFRGYPADRQALAPLIRQAIKHSSVSAQLYEGQWIDVGTPERLQALKSNISNNK